MGKFLDLKKINETELASIERKVRSFVKSTGCNKGEISVYPLDGGYAISVENDGDIAYELATIVKKNIRTKNVTSSHSEGVYDWSSDTYIRPSSHVHFTF